uniref:non-specific serine/threonine protein kinase n=1 Tax=Petromyzon marinus TaxID=7757 RepID=A0AAJ7TJQ0_PETMA|nr:serine/threonine-protein kinase haspin isoform X4 [Petromyzon marinus]
MQGGRMLRTYGRRRGDVYESDRMWISTPHHLFGFSPEDKNEDMEEDGSDGSRRGVGTRYMGHTMPRLAAECEESNCGDRNGTGEKKRKRQRKAKESALLKLKACFEETPMKTPKLTGGGKKTNESPWVPDRAMDVASEEKTIIRRKRMAAKEKSKVKYSEDDNKQLKGTLASSRKNGNDDAFRNRIRLTFNDDSLYSTEETSDISVSGGQGSESSMSLQENSIKDAHKFDSAVGEMRGSDTGHDVKSADGNASFLLENACNKLPFNRFVTVTRKQKISTLSDLEDVFNAEASTGSVESVPKQLAVFASTPKHKFSISIATSGTASRMGNLDFSQVNLANKQMRLRNCKVFLEDFVLHHDIHSFLQKNRVRVSSKILHKLKRSGHLNGSFVQVCTDCLEAGHLTAMDKIASAGDGVPVDLAASVCSDNAERLLGNNDSSHHMDHNSTIMTETLDASRTETPEVQHDGSSLCDNSSLFYIGQTPKLANTLGKDDSSATLDTSRTETSEVEHDGSSLCDSSLFCIGQTPKLANNLGKDDSSAPMSNGKKWSRMKSVLGRRNSVLFTPESPPNKHAALVRRSEFSTAIPLPSLVTTCATGSPNTEACAQGLQLMDMDDNIGGYNAFLSPMLYNDSIQDTEAGLAEENIYRECKQMGPLAFSQWLLSLEGGSCIKVGEGVYGEVFRMCSGRDKVSVFKVVPIEGSVLVNEEPQKSFEEILPEIMICKQLSSLHEGEHHQSENFIKLNGLRCLQGSYPDRLLEAWNEFHENKLSDNDCPNFFTDSQLFIVFEFEDGGTSLETYQFSSMLQMVAVLYQVLVALAVAEEAICFEHRDLHWGNVLVKQTKKKKLSYRLFGQTFSMPTHGVQAKIIDYTLSRMEHDGMIKFTNMALDEMLFQGQGDYQYDIYRMMRNENNNNWAAYAPHTNVLWLHYLAGKMLHGVNCRRRRHVSPRSRLERFAREALAFPSATELVRSGPSLLVSHPHRVDGKEVSFLSP